MRFSSCIFAAVLVVVVAVAGAAVERNGAPTVTVETTRQRIRGQIDERTDDAWLWLRRDFPSTSFLRTVPWNEVIRAEYQGREVTPIGLRRMVEEMRCDHPPSARQGTDLPPKDPRRKLEDAIGESDADRARRLLDLRTNQTADPGQLDWQPPSRHRLRQASSPGYAAPAPRPPR